jgi:hypothetical protein
MQMLEDRPRRQLEVARDALALQLAQWVAIMPAQQKRKTLARAANR